VIRNAKCKLHAKWPDQRPISESPFDTLQLDAVGCSKISERSYDDANSAATAEWDNHPIAKHHVATL
jgi:hypothetical protein